MESGTMTTATERGIPPPLGYHEPTMKAQFGPRVKALREHNRLYRKTLAKLMGVSQHMVRRIELKETMPRIDLVIKLANIFRVSVNYLISDADEPYPIYDPMKNFTAGGNRWK